MFQLTMEDLLSSNIQRTIGREASAADRVLLTNAFVALQYRLAKTNTVDAAERYLEFSRLHPDFTQRLPQNLIASYLGIKPQSLSRIRRQLSEQR